MVVLELPGNLENHLTSLEKVEVATVWNLEDIDDFAEGVVENAATAENAGVVENAGNADAVENRIPAYRCSILQTLTTILQDRE
jgi:hypothetical protein